MASTGTQRTIMAVGAHADDIELNVASTLCKYRDLGYQIIYIMSTNNFSGGWSKIEPDGSVSKSKPPYDVIEPQRKLEANAAAEYFGTEAIHLDHPQRHYTRHDGSTGEVRFGCERPDRVGEDVPTILTAYEHAPSVQQLADLISAHQPEAIVTHGEPMSNIEHTGTSLLVIKAYHKARENGYDGFLLNWCDIAGINTHGPELCPFNTFIDTTDYRQQKFDAIRYHACQITHPERLDLPEMGDICGCGQAEIFTHIHGTPATDDEHPFGAEISWHKFSRLPR